MDIAYLQKLGQVVRNAHRMLQDRGYQVTHANSDPLKIACEAYKLSVENKVSLSEALNATFTAPDGRRADLRVLDRNYDFVKNRDRMISTDQIKSCIQEAAPGRITVVVCPNKLSPLAKKELLGPNIDLFLFDELLIDLPRHELVVPHTIVTPDHVKDCLGTRMNPSDLPVLSQSDPVAKWFRFPKGTIVKVCNPVMPAWRCVV